MCLAVGCGDEATTPDNGLENGDKHAFGFNMYRYGTEFQGIWMFSSTEWIAVASDGVISHFKDGKVISMASGTSHGLNDIWAASRNDIFVVGDDYSSEPGVILRYDGTTWSPMNHSIDVDVTGVFGLTPDNVYATTADGRIFHYEDSGWTMEHQHSRGLADVWASGLTNVVAVGEGGGIVRWDGGSWSDDSVFGDDFVCVWGWAYNDIYVCGGEQIWHYDDNWGPAYSNGGIDLEEIHGSGPEDVWAVGFDNVVVHWNGQAWDETSVGSGNDFHAVWAYTDQRVVALSDHGGVYEFHGSDWEETNNSNQGSWPDIHGSSADEICAVSSGTLWQWDGVAWNEESSLSTYMVAVWCAALDQVWTCGGPGGGNDGYIYYYDGNRWSNADTVVGYRPLDLWGADANHIFAAAEHGLVHSYDGNAWTATQVASPPVDLNGVWGVSATDVFVVGEGGAVYRLTAAGWDEMTSDVTVNLNSVWGAGATSVVAVGDQGAVTRFDGGAWTAETSGVLESLRAVWGDADDNYWAVGYDGTVIHYDGSGWKQVPSGLTEEHSLDTVWGSGGRDVWVAGSNDYLMHYEVLQ